MVLVKAHFLQSSKFKFNSLCVHLCTKLFKPDALLEVLKVRHFVHQVIGEVTVVFGSFNAHFMVLKKTIAESFIWSGQDRSYLLAASLRGIVLHGSVLVVVIVFASPFKFIDITADASEAIRTEAVSKVNFISTAVLRGRPKSSL